MSTKPFDDENIDVEGALNDLDNKLARLRIIYEQYFLGIEKRPPSVPLKQVVRAFHVMENVTIKNTAHKFRLRSLTQKFQAYRSYWHRTEREIENGTYRRHVQKARERETKREMQDALEALGGLDFESEGRAPEPSERTFEEIESPYPSSKAPAAAAPPSNAAAEAAALADDFMRQLMGKPAQAAEPPPAQPEVRGMAADTVQKRADALQRLRDKLGRPGSTAPASGSSTASGGTPAAARPQEPAPTPAGASTPPAPAARPLPTERPMPVSRLGQRSVLPSRPSATTGPQAPVTAAPGPAAGGGSDPGMRRSLEQAGLSEQRLRNLYDSLVDAKRRCNEPLSGLSYDGLVRSIAKQAPSVQAKNGGGAVDFQVVIKKGKAYLKPVSAKDDDL